MISHTQITGGFAILEPSNNKCRGEKSEDLMKGMTSAKRLSAREQQVLDLLVLGNSYLEISGRLSLSYATVHTHIRHIYKKLQVRTRGQAAAKFFIQRAAKSDVISPEPTRDNYNQQTF